MTDGKIYISMMEIGRFRDLWKSDSHSILIFKIIEGMRHPLFPLKRQKQPSSACPFDCGSYLPW